jgi:phosphocarrier protein
MPGSSRRQSEILNALGLHLRAATRFVELSQQFHAKVRVSYNGRVADGCSILELVMLAAGCGARLELEATGPDAEAAATALSALIEARFHENGDGRGECPASDGRGQGRDSQRAAALIGGGGASGSGCGPTAGE